MIDAFVACGGRPDKHGHVRRETLVKIIKHDFGLTIDIEELINKIDTDLSGTSPSPRLPSCACETAPDLQVKSSLRSSRRSCPERAPRERVYERANIALSRHAGWNAARPHVDPAPLIALPPSRRP